MRTLLNPQRLDFYDTFDILFCLEEDFKQCLIVEKICVECKTLNNIIKEYKIENLEAKPQSQISNIL